MRIHVAGLDRNITLIEFVQLFDGFSPTSAFVATHKDSGQGRGFGYVEIPDDYATKVLEMDGFQYRGRRLRIEKAQSKLEREKADARTLQKADS